MRYLLTIGGHHYFRIRVPKDLQEAFECGEIKRALRTRDFKIAKSSVKVISYEFERVINLIRSRTLTDQQVKQLARKFRDKMLESYEWLTMRAKLSPYLETRNCRIEQYSELIQYLKDSLPTAKTELIEPYVDGLLAEEGIPVRKPSEDYLKLCREFTKALIQVYKVETERIKGNFDNQYDRELDATSIEKAPTQLPESKGKLLSEVISEYIDMKSTSEKWNKKNKAESVTFYEQLIKLLGDKPIKDYLQPEITDCIKVLKNFPKNLNKTKGLRELEFKDAIDLIRTDKLKDYPTIGTTTYNKNYGKMNSVFIYALKKHYISVNCAEGFKIHKGKVRPQDQRLDYDTEDLEKWLNSPVYSEYDEDKLRRKPERFWVPLIMLFCGCRTGEVCQLYKEDVKEVDGEWCLDINREKDKSVKNDWSIRIVPIHPFLIKLGLLKFFESIKHERIWINLRKDKEEKEGYAYLFNKWADRFNRQHITKHPKKVPYSLRHSFSTNLKHNGISRELVDEITGHLVEGESFGRYGKAFPVKVKLQAMKKLNYGIDLKHLKFPLKKIR